MRARLGILAFGVIALLVFPASAVMAHPPSSMELEYSGDDGILTIWIAHAVGNVSSHYIKEVEVKVNGDEVAELKYRNQSERDGERILVTIGRFDPGTSIEVKAECSRSGDMKKKIVVQ